MGSLRFFSIIASIFLLGVGFYLLEEVLLPFIVAWVLAYLVVPLVDLLNRRLVRELSILIVFFLLLVVLGGILFGLLPELREQINGFLQQLPSYIQHIDTMTSGLFERLHIRLDAAQIGRQIQAALFKLGSHLVGAPGALVNTATQLVKASIFIVLVPVVAFYLLRDWHDLTAGIESFLRAPGRRKVEQFFRASDRVLRRFIHGELLVMLIYGVLYAAGYMLTGINLGLVLGLLAGVVSVIPFAPFVLSGIPAFIIAVAQFHDLAHPLMIAVTIAATELMENMVLIPLLVGRFVRVHPAAVLLFMFVGGALFGILGMILALPLAAVLNAYWVQFGREEAEPVDESRPPPTT